MTTASPAADLCQPYHFCTYFDRHYLTRGLALYQSLRTHCRRPFVLWTLCFDEESHAILSGLALEDMRLIRREDFEAGDAELAAARANRTHVEYYWTCTPSLPLYVLRQDESIDIITYLDADLFFFSDPQPIFDEFAHGSILIVGHRYAPAYARWVETSGIFNVGIMAFRRNAVGRECLQWWRERCNEWCYAHVADGKYGDQKYLDDWPVRFAGVVVLQHPGAGLAPWNIARYRLEFAGAETRVDGLPLVFFHFHALKVLSPRIMSPSAGCYGFSYRAMIAVFTPYLEALDHAAVVSGLPFVDSFAPSNWLKRVRGILSQDLWRLGSPRVARVLWHIGGKSREARDLLESAGQSLSGCDRRAARCLILRAVMVNPLMILSKPFRVVAMRYLFGTQGSQRP
ncbi:hypothetical protein [uncultured Thiodictyon sp.]|jgi:hypothetical protein|uniref:hypothetical protein n=1 Tax=uncultured Thiodictyon sp. TaxID=1846217 RepID=UPI0025E0BAE6|nr:hypothetical protein [uncultured Thiodictyon sp.]